MTGVLGLPFRRASSGQEVILMQGVIRRLYRLAGIGRAARAEVQEWSGGPTVAP